MTIRHSMLLALAAVATTAAQAQEGKLVDYQCKAPPDIQVEFAVDGRQAILRLPGEQEVVLPARPTSFGFFYDNGRYSLRGKDDELTWARGKGAPVECRAKIGESRDTQARWQLKDTYWRLREVGGQPFLAASGQREPHLVLASREPRMHGFAGCNRMLGGYAQESDSLHFAHVATTMMACVNGMDTETAFTHALEQTVRYRIDGDTLTLIDAEGATTAILQAAALR